MGEVLNLLDELKFRVVSKRENVVDDYGWSHNLWALSLGFRCWTAEFEYRTGLLIVEEPTVEDLMVALRADYSGLADLDDYSHESFKLWAGEYGLDDDSIAARASFDTAISNTNRLRIVLGEYFDEFMRVAETIDEEW